MAPEMGIQSEFDKTLVVDSAAAWLAWMNQSSRRHCHFGLKSAPHHRDFRPGKGGVS